MNHFYKEVRFLVLLSLVVITSIGWIVNKSAARINVDTEIAPGFALLELFTSQGCSSCPPADALLAEYANGHNRQIIPLSFHVDYWNRLGWVDSFSNKQYSERQQWYSQHLPKGSIYTPQLIVNGQSEAVGNNRAGVKALIEKQLSTKQTATIELSTDINEKHVLNCNYAVKGLWENSLVNFALVEKKAITQIRKGENQGLTLTNQNIVRQLIVKPADEHGNQMIRLPENMPSSAYLLVVYLQNKNSGQIHGATQINL